MASIEQALATDRVIDITTIGRTSGRPRRIEIWFEQLDGRYYITGTPGPAAGTPTSSRSPTSRSTSSSRRRPT